MEKSPEAFRTIREVADAMDLPQHVLRFWETRFPQIRPLKRAGGRRYYRPDDVERLRLIKRLLYDEGYTIKGVQKLFKEQGVQAFAQAFANVTNELRAPFDAAKAGERASAPEPPHADPDAPSGGVPGERGEARPDPGESLALRPGPTEEELAALREVLADIREAARILTQARSKES
jgi:DNA-binding transcriptional MerR regulator